MSNRISPTAALAVALPVVVVLLAVFVLARPTLPRSSSPAGAAAPAQEALVPTQATSVERAAPASSTPGVGQAAPTTAPRPSGPRAPELTGGGAWINSEPLSLTDLKGHGKVVLIDFWAYGCYNCTNTLPYLKQWWNTYKDQGLVIVGVHTPEFESEKLLENVREAVQRQEIGWPVVQDNDKYIWRAYDNHYWPHFYLVDHHGQIIYDHIGEGAYEETERQIQAALATRD